MTGDVISKMLHAMSSLLGMWTESLDLQTNQNCIGAILTHSNLWRIMISGLIAVGLDAL
jgi:hypothetical protein